MVVLIMFMPVFVARVLMMMFMSVFVMVAMFMAMILVRMAVMRMFVLVLMIMFVIMMPVPVILGMHVKLCSGYPAALLTGYMQVVAMHLEPLDLMFEFVGVHAEVEHCTDEHIAADAAKNIEIENVHGYFSSP